jgi:hypothetical protein
VIEPFAFGSEAPGAPAGFLPVNATAATLSGVPLPAERFTLAHASAASGWAWADVIAADAGALAPSLDGVLGFGVPLWSVAAEEKAPSPIFEIGDAGITENLHLISLLRRTSLKHFVMFHDTSVPIATRATWDPSQRPPTAKDIDDTIPSYFGLDPDPKSSLGYDYHRNHVFNIR